MRIGAMLLLVTWFAVCTAVAIALADGRPRYRASTHFIIASHMECYGGPCSRIEVISAGVDRDWSGDPAQHRTLAVVPGRVRGLWYTFDGTIRYVADWYEGGWPDFERHRELWSMERDGSHVHLIDADYAFNRRQMHNGRLTARLEIPVQYDTNYDELDKLKNVAPYVALTSPDGELVVSRVAGIDSSQICISTADDWDVDVSFRAARCFGDGQYSLPVWVAN